MIPVCMFFDMVSPVKTQVENGLINLFYFQVHNIDISEKDSFTLKDSGINDD